VNLDANPLNAISCPSTSLCVAVDPQGNAVLTTDPTDPVPTWGPPTNADTSTLLLAVSCATTSLCVGVDDGGNAVISTNPTAASPTWSPPASIDSADNHPINGVSCVAVDYWGSSSVDDRGNALVTTNPTSATPTWAIQNIDGTNLPQAVSCGATSLCVAVDNLGRAFVGHVPLQPANTSRPTIAGIAYLGQLSTENHGSWTHNPTDFGYEWEDCDLVGGNCSAISGATGPTYTLTQADLGRTIRVIETAFNADARSAPAGSAQTGVVQAPAYTLTVATAGTGAGRVSGNGISCPGACTHVYGNGSTVALSAPGDPGTAFAGWSGGGCSGTGPCYVQMASNESVTAVFNVVLPPPPPPGAASRPRFRGIQGSRDCGQRRNRGIRHWPGSTDAVAVRLQSRADRAAVVLFRRQVLRRQGPQGQQFLQLADL
jgi:hypothetical protein